MRGLRAVGAGVRQAGAVTVAALAVGCAKAPPPVADHDPDASVASCRGCHAGIVDSYLATAHLSSSAAASPSRVKGSFAAGRNTLTTRSADVSFEMSSRQDGLHQTAFDRAAGQSRTERIDLVIGSGRRGQTYLYWRNGILVELPVSYLTTADAWINSPGYQDGTIDFGRVVPPRCLECHANNFRVEGAGLEARYAADYELGIGCARCHGDGRLHAQYQAEHPDSAAQYIVNPAGLPRERQLDNCALCHSGPRRLLKPPFSYQPGQVLDQFLVPTGAATDSSTPDVHGDQIGLLARSKCFRASPAMTCSTCHDVHREQRDPVAFAATCRSCHTSLKHPNAQALGDRLTSLCVDCHMPNEASRGIQISNPTDSTVLRFRSHRIAVYPAHATELLRTTGPPR